MVKDNYQNTAINCLLRSMNVNLVYFESGNSEFIQRFADICRITGSRYLDSNRVFITILN